MKCSVFILVLSTLVGPTWPQSSPPLVPFTIDWRDNDDCLVDLSFLLDAPAGRGGSVRVADGHLVKPDGKRLRIWGVNFTGAACFPEKEDAPVVARHLARYGINSVRFHFLDSNWGAEASVFDSSRDDTAALDARQMDRLDFFVGELKKRGIYSNFNLNVGRVYRKGDGVADHEYIGFGKGIQYYDDRVAQLHCDYAQLLLTHRNPYTKTEYRHEPALVIVELVNENSLVESWFAGRLRGTRKTKHPGTWSDVTRHYADLLTAKYNDWLGQHLSGKDLEELRRSAGVAAGEPVPRLEPRQFGSASERRFHAEARFYMELEDAYFQRLRRLLRKLEVKALLVATSDHNHYRSGYPLLSSAAKLDVVDGHVYWQHPRYIREQGKTRGFWIPNSPLVADPLSSTVVRLARSAVAGKPYTVSETNHPFPNAFACEGIGILAAYALFQDWDGIYFYTFEHKDPREWLTRTPGHFDVRADPVKMTNLAAAALMFHRGDVRPALRRVQRSYSQEQIIETIRMPSSQRPFFSPGFSAAIPLVYSTRIESFQKRKDSYPELELTRPIASDTGELKWHHGNHRGLVTIETRRTQGMIGYLRESRPELEHLAARVENEFCAVLLSSLDGAPLRRADQMLLAVTARSETTGMRWDEKRNTLVNWGRPPFRIEPVRGAVTLRRRTGEGPLEVIPMNGSGKELGEGRAVPAKSGVYEITLDQPTTWYLIRRRKNQSRNCRRTWPLRQLCIHGFEY